MGRSILDWNWNLETLAAEGKYCLEEMARLKGVSPRHMRRYLERRSNRHPHDVISELRDKHLQQLLEEGKYLKGSTRSSPQCQRSGVSCQRIPNSDGKEDKAFDCCEDRHKSNSGIWFPGLNDCHNKTDNCLNEAGVPPEDVPPHKRIGKNRGVE